MTPRQRPRTRSMVAVVLLGAAVAACAHLADDALPPRAQVIDSGSWYVKEPWPHDGNPVATEHFVVYSDGASPGARRRLGALAEDVWSEVIDDMGLDPPTMFTFPAGQERIDLYANRYNVLEGGGARAYYAGVILPSFDFAGESENTDVAVIRVTLRHELVHVAEALLKGRFVGDLDVGDPRRMPVWFSEGSAEALSGGSTVGPPRTLDQLTALVTRYGLINPIGWKVDLPISDAVLDAYPHFYYPMAHLAVDYLLDPRGLGRTPRDITAVMLDMGDDVPFADAFAAHMGISVSEYEAQFFTRMGSYLPQSEFPFEAVGLGTVVVGAGAILIRAIMWGLRHRATRGAGGMRASVRRVLIIEVWLTAALVLGFVALALFSIGFDVFPAGADRASAYAATGVFFGVAVGTLMSAARRSSSAARRWPYAVFPAIAFLAIATEFLIEATLL